MPSHQSEVATSTIERKVTPESRFSASFSLKTLLLWVAVAATATWTYANFHPFGPLFAFWCLVLGLGITNRLTKRIRGPLLVFASLLSMPGCLYLIMEGHPVSIHRLEQIQIGTPKSNVAKSLGRPHLISADGHEWTYVNRTWCHVSITFDENDKVSFLVHDH